MKSLFRSILKLIYCVIFPISMIWLTVYMSHYARVEMNMLSEMTLYICTIAVCFNSIFWFVMMSNTRIIPKKYIPKFSTEKWKGIGFGFGMEKRGTGVLLVLPFIVLELSW